jgi:hypothetical protein
MSARSRNFGRASLTLPDEARPVEHDTLTCSHCQRVVCVKPGSASTVYRIWSQSQQQWVDKMGAFCRVCMLPICLACEPIGRCIPWERRLEASERRARLHSSVGV